MIEKKIIILIQEGLQDSNLGAFLQIIYPNLLPSHYFLSFDIHHGRRRRIHTNAR